MYYCATPSGSASLGISSTTRVHKGQARQQGDVGQLGQAGKRTGRLGRGGGPARRHTVRSVLSRVGLLVAAVDGVAHHAEIVDFLDSARRLALFGPQPLTQVNLYRVLECVRCDDMGADPIVPAA